MPAIYNKYPSDEDLYALFRNNAELYRRDVSFSIYLLDRLPYRYTRKSEIKKGYKHKYSLQESSKYEEYIALLDKILMKYHGTHPVHNVNELRLLAEKFPYNIKLYTAEKKGRIEAGTVLFCSLVWYIHSIWLIRMKEKNWRLGLLAGLADYRCL